MSGLVERLRNISRGDHERGCQGREYVCSCDYDETSWNTAEDAADELDRLRRELEEAQGANEALRAKALEWLNAYKAESEVAKEARCKAFEEAAEIAYRTCAETRHVKLGDACASAIRARAALRAEEEGK